MRRLVVQPRLFGTMQGYQWDVDSAPRPHNDYCQLWQYEYSVRVWEPTRMSLSTPGVYGVAGTDYESVPLPSKAHIRGIKGDAFFRFDGTPQGVGVVLYDDGTPWNPQPSADQIYEALGGVPAGTLIGFTGDEYRDFNPGFYIPLFCAMYRGTYKSIDTAPGWEIDTGPGDDPDVLLPLDITSPDVLESGRLDWWALDQVRLPHTRTERVWGGETVYNMHNVTSGSHHRFALNLDANKRVSADQVLWLHWKTGAIKLPIWKPGVATGGEVQCGTYVGHKFNVAVHATMLVDTAVSVG